jgi:ferredoxin-type protein NapF
LAAKAEAPARPPWSVLPDADFIARCTRCGDCVRVCPTKVLSAGDGGFPVIRFDQAGCSLCGECATACQTRAISRAEQPVAFAWKVQVSNACLNRQGVECRVCGDACDTHALRFKPAPGGISQLQIDLESCTGCGECVAVCPVAAISVGS